MEARSFGETSLAFLQRMRSKRSLKQPLGLTLHQGEILPVIGPQCSGKTEFALKAMASACIAAANEAMRSSKPMNEKACPEVFFFSIGDIFPMQRFIRVLESAYGQAYGECALPNFPQNGSQVEEEQYFISWMERVTTRCHVTECMAWGDSELALAELARTDAFRKDPGKVPICIIDCGKQSVGAVSVSQSGDSTSPSRKRRGPEQRRPFFRISRYLLPNVLNAYNACALLLYRASPNQQYGDTRDNPSLEGCVSLDGQGTIRWQQQKVNESQDETQKQAKMEVFNAIYRIDVDEGFVVHG